METHNSVIPDNASKKVDMCCCDLHAANDIIPASVSSVQYVAVNSIGKKAILMKLTVCQLVKKFATFYGTGCSLSCLLVPIPSQMNPVDTLISYFCKIYNTVLPSIPRPSKWSLSFRFPHKNPVCISPHHHTCNMPYPYHPP